jgi:SWI/SNF-related matrix-associated actin-dependent regulator 1 of chromatin subfamily A
MVVTNYDILPNESELPANVPADLVVICDEVHVIKNSKAQRTVRTRAILATARKNGGRTWGLTATPMLNKPTELWNLLAAFGLEREVFGSWPRFVRLFNGVRNEWGGMIWGEPEPEVATLLQRVSLRREKIEVMKDLPPKTRTARTVDIPKKLTKQLDKVWDKVKNADWDDIFDGGKGGLGIAFEEISAARAALAEAKIPAMLELVESYEEQEVPIVVFSAHLAPLHELAKREGWAMISGDTPPEKRTQIENDFQAGLLRGVAASIKAGGVAITLTRASNAIFVDLLWTPSLNDQAEDRLYRIGQANAVLITRLMANHPLDERVMELLTEKQALISATIERSAVSAGAVLPTSY